MLEKDNHIAQARVLVLAPVLVQSDRPNWLVAPLTVHALRVFANSGTKDNGSLEPCTLVIQNNARVGPGAGGPQGSWI